MRAAFTRRRLPLLLLALSVMLGRGSSLSAQTIEIQCEIAAFIAEERDTFGVLSWAWRWARTLNTEIDLRDLGERKSLNRTLGYVAEQFAKKGRWVYGEIDFSAFEKKSAGASAADIVVDFSSLPERVTLSRLLMEILDQIPDKDATVVLKGIHFEITTVHASGHQGWSFHFARKLAPAVRIWLWAGLACALLFLILRAPAVWRRQDGRFAGLIALTVKCGLVFVFWPVWLLVLAGSMRWWSADAKPQAAV